MEFGMFRRIKPKEKYVRFSMKDVSRNLDGPSKHLWSYVVVLNLGRKEGNVLFNNALNTFYLRLYGVEHMV